MDDGLSITHERLDDIPVVFAVARQLGLPEILDEALGGHGNQRGLSYGWLATSWLAYMLVEGDHRKSVVEAWGQQRRGLLELLTGQAIRDSEFNDDRLGRLLTRLADAERWQAIEAALWKQTALAYELRCGQVRLDSTTSYGYHAVGEDGLMQLGHSKDHRPDKPQLKLMAAVAEPAGQMLASKVYPGNTADDGLYVPMVERVRQIAGPGLLYVGDAKMAALETRRAIVAGGDHYLTRLPKPAYSKDLDRWIDQALASDGPLTSIGAADAVFGSGYEFTREVSHRGQTWTERVLVYRSSELAERETTGLERRLAAARADLLALTPPVGPGRRQLTTMKRFLAAIGRIETKHRVDGLLWVKWCREAYPSRKEPDRERFLVAGVIRRDERIEATQRRLGWQVLVTSVPAAELPLADTVLTYNAGWHIELQFRDIKDRPLGIRPLLVRSDEQITGLTHLLTLALRLMTLITTTVRRSLQQSGETLVGLFEGQKSRATDRPTARRLLRAFHRQEITLIRIRGPGQNLNHLAPLPPLLSTILRHLGLGDNVYTDLADDPAQ